MMPSEIRKRSISVNGHPTSISLEKPFFDALHEIAAAENISLSELVGRIDRERRTDNLSSALRIFVLDRLRAGQRQPFPVNQGNG